jgi:Tfp pilus assembly protein PilW
MRAHGQHDPAADMLSRRMSPRATPRAQAGLSIVELMVGVAVGLIVVAAATTLMTQQMVENRRLLTETQLQQDLRATADIIARELRRAGALAEHPNHAVAPSPSAPDTVFVETPSGGQIAAQANAHARKLDTPASDQIKFTYNVSDSGYVPGDFEFKLTSGEILSRMSGTTPNFQPLTDRKIMVVTRFEVDRSSPATASSLHTLVPCPKQCADGTANCWPQYSVREVVFTIEAQAANDPNVKRAVTTRVRVRADLVRFRAPALPAGTVPASGTEPPLASNYLVCPA